MSAGIDTDMSYIIFAHGVITDIENLSILHNQIFFFFVDSGHIDQITVSDNQHCFHLPFSCMQSDRR